MKQITVVDNEVLTVKYRISTGAIFIMNAKLNLFVGMTKNMEDIIGFKWPLPRYVAIGFNTDKSLS